MKNKIILIAFFVTVLSNLFIVEGYKIDPDKEVHQYIAKEAVDIWKVITYEIKNHSNNTIDTILDGSFAPDSSVYDIGDDIITGSAEQDRVYSTMIVANTNHFWNPDNPQNGDYNDGLVIFGSSYKRAENYWKTKVIPLYLKGNINESYYWLGHVVHLLEDASAPPHVLNDCHPDQVILNLLCQRSSGDNFLDDSIVEEYTGNNFNIWKGINYIGGQYNYEKLSNMSGFNWSSVEPTYPSFKQNKELFRLFWYTAQKTQYFASDDVDGNDVYQMLNGSIYSFSPSLWGGEQVTLINKSSWLIQDDITDSGTNISLLANATIPHAMKATAGLYRLFWDAVKIDWPMTLHDLHRTSYTLLKGDMNSTSHNISWEIQGDNTTDFYDIPEITEIINNNNPDETFIKQELIVSTCNYDGDNGRVYALYGNGTQIWEYTPQKCMLFPSVNHIDNNNVKEIVMGSTNPDNKLYVLNAQTGQQKWTYTFPNSSTISDPVNESGWTVGPTIADIDSDGINEIIAVDFNVVDVSWLSHIYAFEGNGTQKWNNTITRWGASNFSIGSQDHYAVDDIDSDGLPEIAVAATVALYVYNGEDGSQLWNKTELFKMSISPVISDVDDDGELEIIITTFNDSCTPSPPCMNAIHVLNTTGGEEWNRTFLYFTVNSPAVANLDNDNNLEIVVPTQQDVDYSNAPNSGPSNATIIAYDGKTGNVEWTYRVDGYKVQHSPIIFDIDNDGKLEVLFAAYDGLVRVLNQNGTLEWTENVSSEIAASPAVGDIDGDGVAEVAVKHRHGIGRPRPTGPPIWKIPYIFNLTGEPHAIYAPDTVSKANTSRSLGGGFETLGAGGGDDASSELTIIGGNNTPPRLNLINNITIKEGNLIRINATANDTEDNPLTYYYSAPINSSSQWQTNSSHNGTYEILVEVNDGSLSDYQLLTLDVVNEYIEVTGLGELYSEGSGTHKTFEIKIKNNNVSSMNNVSWKFDTGDNNISSNNAMNLTPKEEAILFIDHNYTKADVYNATATAIFGNINHSLNMTVYAGDLIVTDLKVLNSNLTEKIFEFRVLNNMNQNITGSNWALNTGETIINATTSINLKPQETAFIFVNYNYASGGNYVVNASITNGTLYDDKILSITVNASDYDVNLYNFTILNSSGTERIFEFLVQNTGSVNLNNFEWNMTVTGESGVNGTQALNLTPSEIARILVNYNYTSGGLHNVTARVDPSNIISENKENDNEEIIIND